VDSDDVWSSQTTDARAGGKLMEEGETRTVHDKKEGRIGVFFGGSSSPLNTLLQEHLLTVKKALTRRTWGGSNRIR